MSENKKILLLEGVYPNTCKSIDERLLGNLSLEGDDYYSDISSSLVYDKIPSSFTTLEDWIKDTKIPCFNCSKIYNTTPLPMPINMTKKNVTHIDQYETHDENQANEVFTTKYLYCSFPCMICDLHNRVEFQRRIDSIYDLCLKLYTKFTGKIVPNLPKGIDKSTLLSWGGSLTDDKYDRLHKKKMEEIQKNIIANLIEHVSIYSST